jgi:hypothetical protein
MDAFPIYKWFKDNLSKYEVDIEEIRAIGLTIKQKNSINNKIKLILLDKIIANNPSYDETLWQFYIQLWFNRNLYTQKLDSSLINSFVNENSTIYETKISILKYCVENYQYDFPPLYRLYQLLMMIEVDKEKAFNYNKNYIFQYAMLSLQTLKEKDSDVFILSVGKNVCVECMKLDRKYFKIITDFHSFPAPSINCLTGKCEINCNIMRVLHMPIYGGLPL